MAVNITYEQSFTRLNANEERCFIEPFMAPEGAV